MQYCTNQLENNILISLDEAKTRGWIRTSHANGQNSECSLQEFGHAFCFSIIGQISFQWSHFRFYISTLKTALEHYIDYRSTCEKVEQLQLMHKQKGKHNQNKLLDSQASKINYFSQCDHM